MLRQIQLAEPEHFSLSLLPLVKASSDWVNRLKPEMMSKLGDLIEVLPERITYDFPAGMNM